MGVMRVCPADFAEQASDILTAAWSLPSVNYSSAYLKWQLSSPGALEPLAIAAFEGTQPIAFAASINRRLRLGRLTHDMYLLSFYGSRPEHRGPAGMAVLRAELRILRQAQVSFLSFAPSGSLSEQILLAACKAAGQTHIPLGSCRSHGAAVRPEKTSDFEAEEATDDEELRKVYDDDESPGILWSNPTGEQFAHYRRDPRGAVLALVRPAPERPAIGAAHIVRTELLTSEGLQSYATIDSVHLHQPSADALAAVVQLASRLWPNQVNPRLVLAPNLSGIGPAVLRAAGFREMPRATIYNAHLFTYAPDDPLIAARSTNLEVV